MRSTGSGVGGTARRQRGKVDKRRQARGQRSSMSRRRFAIIASVIGLLLIALFIMLRVQNKPAEPRSRDGSVTGAPTGIQRKQNKSAAPLPSDRFVRGTPINTVDPTSGKPIVAGITSTYQGLTIGHCCETSKQQWAALTVAEKEAALQPFLK
jgi:hypothetical protein